MSHFVHLPADGICDLRGASTVGKTFSADAYSGGLLKLGNIGWCVIDCTGVSAPAEQMPILSEHDADKKIGYGRAVINATSLAISDGKVAFDNEHSRRDCFGSQSGLSVPGEHRRGHRGSAQVAAERNRASQRPIVY